VLRRGPTSWFHVGRWDLAARRYEAGAWLRGRLFPRRSDVSPDGRYLCTFAHKPGATWRYGSSYVAVSRLPWLTALHAFATCGTWTRGYCFARSERGHAPAETVGAERLPNGYTLRAIGVEQFATERRRGWRESADSPARHTADAWDERRNARLEKRQPGGELLLCVAKLGRPCARTTEGAIDGVLAGYWIEANGELEPLDELQWADWDEEGRLLVATRDGRLQIRDVANGRGEVLFEEDLSGLEPAPAPAPQWASEW
jgi:hypothetical protein